MCANDSSWKPSTTGQQDASKRRAQPVSHQTDTSDLSGFLFQNQSCYMVSSAVEMFLPWRPPSLHRGCLIRSDRHSNEWPSDGTALSGTLVK